MYRVVYHQMDNEFNLVKSDVCTGHFSSKTMQINRLHGESDAVVMRRLVQCSYRGVRTPGTKVAYETFLDGVSIERGSFIPL